MACRHAGEDEDEVVGDADARTLVAERFARALLVATDEQARSRALRDISDALRDGRLHVRTCAWCGAISLGAGWHRTSTGHLVATLSRYSAATHGICPTCFDEHAPGVPYPDAPPGKVDTA